MEIQSAAMNWNIYSFLILISLISPMNIRDLTITKFQDTIFVTTWKYHRVTHYPSSTRIPAFSVTVISLGFLRIDTVGILWTDREGSKERISGVTKGIDEKKQKKEGTELRERESRDVY